MVASGDRAWLGEDDGIAVHGPIYLRPLCDTLSSIEIFPRFPLPLLPTLCLTLYNHDRSPLNTHSPFLLPCILDHPTDLSSLSQVCGDEPRQLPFPIIQPIDMDDVAAVAPEYEGSLISTVLDEISTPDARLR